MSELLGHAGWIALLGMGVTFGALALVMASMFALTRLFRDPAGDDVQAEPPAAVDLVLPAGTPLEQVAAAVVAVAAARELARQRHSAQLWLGSQPRSLISPWQLASRDRLLDRVKQ